MGSVEKVQGRGRKEGVIQSWGNKGPRERREGAAGGATVSRCHIANCCLPLGLVSTALCYPHHGPVMQEWSPLCRGTQAPGNSQARAGMGRSALVSWVDFEAPHLWRLISQADLPLWTTRVGGTSLPITGKTQMLK